MNEVRGVTTDQVRGLATNYIAKLKGGPCTEAAREPVETFLKRLDTLGENSRQVDQLRDDVETSLLGIKDLLRQLRLREPESDIGTVPVEPEGNPLQKKVNVDDEWPALQRAINTPLEESSSEPLALDDEPVQDSSSSDYELDADVFDRSSSEFELTFGDLFEEISPEDLALDNLHGDSSSEFELTLGEPPEEVGFHEPLEEPIEDFELLPEEPVGFKNQTHAIAESSSFGIFEDRPFESLLSDEEELILRTPEPSNVRLEIQTPEKSNLVPKEILTEIIQDAEKEVAVNGDLHLEALAGGDTAAAQAAFQRIIIAGWHIHGLEQVEASKPKSLKELRSGLADFIHDMDGFLGQLNRFARDVYQTSIKVEPKLAAQPSGLQRILSWFPKILSFEIE